MNKKEDDDYDSGNASNPALLTHIWEVDHPSKKKKTMVTIKLNQKCVCVFGGGGGGGGHETRLRVLASTLGYDFPLNRRSYQPS